MCLCGSSVPGSFSIGAWRPDGPGASRYTPVMNRSVPTRRLCAGGVATGLLNRLVVGRTGSPRTRLCLTVVSGKNAESSSVARSQHNEWSNT